MVICALLVSTSFPVGQHITTKLDPAIITLTRFIVATTLLAPVISVKYGLHVSVKSLLRYSVVSACLVFFFWCMFLALRYTSQLNASVLFTSVPALSFVYAAVIVRERLGLTKILALFFGLIGALWVIFQGDMNRFLSLAWNKGDLIFFAGCLAMGLYTPLVKRLHRGEPMEVMTFWVLVTGTIWLLPVGVCELGTVDFYAVPVTIWFWIVYLSVFTTIITFYLTQLSIPVIGPTRVMSYSYLYPGLVLVIDFLAGRGLPETKIFPGLLLIVISMVILQTSRTR